MFAFTPHGIVFKVPVTMTIPFDPALVPVGMSPVFYKTNAARHRMGRHRRRHRQWRQAQRAK